MKYTPCGTGNLNLTNHVATITSSGGPNSTKLRSSLQLPDSNSQILSEDSEILSECWSQSLTESIVWSTGNTLFPFAKSVRRFTVQYVPWVSSVLEKIDKD